MFSTSRLKLDGREFERPVNYGPSASFRQKAPPSIPRSRQSSWSTRAPVTGRASGHEAGQRDRRDPRHHSAISSASRPSRCRADDRGRLPREAFLSKRSLQAADADSRPIVIANCQA
jgi:hypothetical protein